MDDEIDLLIFSHVRELIMWLSSLPMKRFWIYSLTMHGITHEHLHVCRFNKFFLFYCIFLNWFTNTNNVYWLFRKDYIIENIRWKQKQETNLNI